MLLLQVDCGQAGDAVHSALCTNIAALFDNPVSSDVAIKAGNTTVHAHKLILAAQSPALQAMFQVKHHGRNWLAILAELDVPIDASFMH